MELFEVDYRPTKLIADAARAITRGFQQAFYYNSSTNVLHAFLWNKNNKCQRLSKLLQTGHRLICFQTYKLIKFIDINNDNWLLSQSRYSFWSKNYYCNHMIVAAEKLKKCQYLYVHKQIGIHDDNKRKRGRRQKTKTALNRQPAECELSSDSSNEIDTSS